MPRAHPADRGFTLIETLVVLSIVALSMAVVPAVMSGLDGSRLRAAADELVADLRETRNLALRRDGPAELLLDARRLRYALPGMTSTRAFPPAVRSVQITPATLVQSDGIAHIRFLADGTATEALIALRRQDGIAEIRVEWLTGRVSRGG